VRPHDRPSPCLFKGSFHAHSGRRQPQAAEEVDPVYHRLLHITPASSNWYAKVVATGNAWHRSGSRGTLQHGHGNTTQRHLYHSIRSV
jgi:hypothetical protein